MMDNKYKFTGDIDSITFKEGNPLDAYLPDGTKLQAQDMGNYYAYSNGQNIWRIPRSKFEGEQQKKGPAEDIDKVMLGTLAMGLGPIALPKLFGSLVTNIVNNPQMWGQALQRTTAGMAGYEGVNELNKAINNETWGEGINRITGGKIPVWLGDLTNPGGFLEGVVTNAGNKLLNLTIKTPQQYLKFNPDAMYRIIGEAGYRDALQSGVLRPNMDPTSKYYRGVNKTYNWFTKGHPNDRKHPVIFSNGKMPIDRVYPGDVIVEVLPQHPQFSEFKPHLEDAGIYKIEPRLSINSPYIKFYKQDKKGYVPYPQIINNNSNNLLTNIWQQISKSTAPFQLYRAINKSNPNTQQIFPGLIGWTPRNTFSGYHASNEPIFNPDYFFNGWVQKTHGAPHGVYFAEGTKPTSGFLTKRPYVHQRQFIFDKPQIQIGEVAGTSKNGIRNQIERNAQQQGADGIIYSGIADNQMKNQIIYKTLHPDVIIKSPMQMKGSYGIDDLHIITKPEEVTQITRLQSDSSIPYTSNSHFNAGYWIRQDPSKLISLKEIPNLQETINNILKNTNQIKQEFLDSNYINGFRNIAQQQSINVSSLSNEDIAKILTEQYDQLANTSSGLLKNKVFWRTWGRYKPQDYFDWQNHLGELTKNEGFWGSGNYFASGRMAVDNIPSNNNPYMIKGITEIGYDDLLGATDAAGDAIRSGELAGAKLSNAWMNESPNTRLVAATPKGMHNRYGWIDDNQFGIEVVTKKNSEIKSLYPDLRNGNGQTFVRDWSNPNTFQFSTQPVQRFEGTQETSIHPLEARLARLQEKVKEGVIPETKQLGLIGKDLTPMDIKGALIEIDPNLTDKEIQGAIQVAMAKKQGVHIPFGTENTTDAGLSIVDIADAVRLLRKHNITNPTSKDIENIIAHEFGHSTAYEIPEDVRPLLQGYYDPNEFFTQAGQILDNAGIKETINNPVSYKDFMDMLAQYQSQGNLDNGISQLADFMKQFSATSGNRWKDASTIVKRNQLMKYINRLSAGLYGAYLLRKKNGEIQQ